jgi:hypothetical protein
MQEAEQAGTLVMVEPLQLVQQEVDLPVPAEVEAVEVAPAE